MFVVNGQQPTGWNPIEWSKKVETLGAGEILLYSIDRDGSRQGYDLEVLQQVSEAVKIPVIACGGVGRMEHLVEGILKRTRSSGRGRKYLSSYRA